MKMNNALTGLALVLLALSLMGWIDARIRIAAEHAYNVAKHNASLENRRAHDENLLRAADDRRAIHTEIVQARADMRQWIIEGQRVTDGLIAEQGKQVGEVKVVKELLMRAAARVELKQ